MKCSDQGKGWVPKEPQAMGSSGAGDLTSYQWLYSRIGFSKLNLHAPEVTTTLEIHVFICCQTFLRFRSCRDFHNSFFFFLSYFIGKDTEAQRALSDILTYIFQSRPEPEFKPVSHDSLCISLPTISCLVFMKFIIFIVMDFSFWHVNEENPHEKEKYLR